MLGMLEHTGKQTVRPGDIDNLVGRTSMQKIHEVITSSSYHNQRKGHKLEGKVCNGLYTQEELGEEVGGRGGSSIEKQVRLRALKLGRSWAEVEGGVSGLCGWMQEHKHRHRRREGASGNRESNRWLQKKFRESIYLERELVKARLGLGSILLRIGSTLMVSKQEGRHHQRQALGKFIWSAHGLVRKD